jgi:sodium-independent sulfate anion transporter 11
VKTPAGGLFTGGLVLLALAVLTPLFYYIPDSALAGVIIMAVLDMASFYLPKRLWRIKKIDLLPWFVTFIFSFVLGIEFGIILGVLVALLFLLYPWARPRVKIAKDDDEDGKVANYGVSEKEVCIVQLDQGLRFPGVEFVRQTIMNKAVKDDTLRPTILDCSHIADMDYSSVQCLETLNNDFALKQTMFVVACPRETTIDVIRNAHIKGLNVFDSVEEAIHHVTGEKDETEKLLAENGNMQGDCSV